MTNKLTPRFQLRAGLVDFQNFFGLSVRSGLKVDNIGSSETGVCVLRVEIADETLKGEDNMYSYPPGQSVA